jgi:hypothetical protein
MTAPTQEVIMTSRKFHLFIFGVLLVLPAVANADYLGGVTYSQHNPSTLPHSEYVDVTIDYKVTEAGGGVIFARPYTNGAPTPNYAATGGDVVPAGAGTVTQSFRITSGEHTVDQVRVYLKSPDLTQTWLEMFLPVSFAYGSNAVTHMNFSHTRYSVLKHGQQYSVTFDYQSSDPAGCRVFMRPYTNGALTPGYSASGSAVLPQAGTTTQWFSFASDADVTHLHFTVNDHNNVPLFEHDIPFPLQWRSVGVYDIHFDRPPETSLANTQNVTTSFTLDHDVPGGLRVWARPMIGENYPPQFSWQPSGLEPAGAHTLSRFCRVHVGEQYIAGIQLQVATETQVILEFTVPVDYHWAPHAVQNVVFTPASPAILSNGEFLGAAVDYITTATGDVRLYALPALDYVLVPGSPTYTTTIYPPPSGSAACYCTFTSGDHVGDSMRFRMATSDWSQVLLTHFYHGHFAWGSTAVITPVPEAGVVAAAQLGATYPNPFNPAATIPVILADDATVRLAVFDLRGRLVQTLVDGALPAGRHEFRFDGSGLSSGTYLCRLDGPGGPQTRRMTLVK